MKNHKFYWLLHEPRDGRGLPCWTVAMLAREIGSGRAHVTEVLNNVPGHGGKTRRKLVAVFRGHFPYWREMLAALGWTECGELLNAESVSQFTVGRGRCSTWKVPMALP
ncbi:MAG: hypothetical protein ABFD89_06760 [Bryobacteraceae bacterium]